MVATIKRATSAVEWLVLGDLHFPFEDRSAVTLVKKVIRHRKPHGVVLIGDVFDNKALSRHMKDMSERLFRREFSDAKASFFELDEACRGIERKVITSGNHDEYLSGYIMRNCPELEGYEGLRTPFEVVGAKERGWNVLPYHEPYHVGKLGLVHDVNMAGDSAIQQAVAKFGRSVGFGHTHRAGLHYSGNIEGERFVAMNVGWLGDPYFAKYMPGFAKSNNWTHALGHVRVLNNGLFFCRTEPIVKGHVVIDGTVYTL